MKAAKSPAKESPATATCNSTGSSSAKKLGRNAEEDFGGKALGDSKDSDDFAYLTYETLPKFTPAKSLLGSPS